MDGRAGRASRIANVASRFTSPADVFLAVRVMGWALVLPVLKRIVPVRSLAPMMRRAPEAIGRDEAREERIVAFARWAARLVRWRSGGNCLERALIAYRYLGAAGANPTLVVGLDRDGGDLIGHAWVVVDGRPAGEDVASLRRYAPAFAFGPAGALEDAPRDEAIGG